MSTTQNSFRPAPPPRCGHVSLRIVDADSIHLFVGVNAIITLSSRNETGGWSSVWEIVVFILLLSGVSWVYPFSKPHLGAYWCCPSTSFLVFLLTAFLSLLSLYCRFHLLLSWVYPSSTPQVFMSCLMLMMMLGVSPLRGFPVGRRGIGCLMLSIHLILGLPFDRVPLTSITIVCFTFIYP